MGAATKDRPSGAQSREMKATREAAEAAKIAEAHAALGTDTGSIDDGPQNVHDGDPDETGGTGGTVGPAPSQLEMFSKLVGGKASTSNTTRLVGGKIEVDQKFMKGQKIRLVITAEVGSVAFVDQRDGKTGQVIGSERRHSARILNVEVQ